MVKLYTIKKDAKEILLSLLCGFDNEMAIKFIISLLIFYGSLSISEYDIFRSSAKIVTLICVAMLVLLNFNKILSHKRVLKSNYSLPVFLFALSLFLSVLFGLEYKNMYEYTKYNSTFNAVLFDLSSLVPSQILVVFLIFLSVDKIEDLKFYIKIILISGIIYNLIGVIYLFQGFATDGRMGSIFIDANYLGRFELFIFAILFTYLLLEKKSFLLKIFYVLLCIFSFVFLVISYSRSSQITFFVISITLIFWIRNKLIKVSFILIVIVVFITSYFIVASQRTILDNSGILFSIVDLSNTTRYALNVAAVNMFLDHTIFGVGYYNFYNVYINHNYVPLDIPLNVIVVVVHSWLFSILAELGLFGIISFVWLIYCFIRDLLKCIKFSPDNEYKNIGIILFLFIFIFVFNGMFFPIFYPELTFSVFAGLAAGYLKISSGFANINYKS